MRTRLLAGILVLLTLTGCAGIALPVGGGKTRVVTTNVILADLVRQVGGDDVTVTPLVPAGADPHSYEPSLRAVRDVAYADAAFSNYLLLESHAVIKALDATMPAGRPNVSIAEASTKHGAQVIAMVENRSLDALWLGLRVRGTGAQFGANRTSDVQLTMTDVSGPGSVKGYVTGTFGQPQVFFDSTQSGRPQTVTLPPAAHTHMSWAFTRPGRYRIGFSAAVVTDKGTKQVGTEHFDVLVGSDPADMAAVAGKQLLEKGHADLTADLDEGSLYLWADESGGGERTQSKRSASDTVIHVLPQALTEVPGDPGFRFLGNPGTQLYQLPQAVLGAHVHGEIDPHLWLNVANTKAYVKVIEATLSQVDPANAGAYAARAAAYQDELAKLAEDVATTIGTIPPERRHLITTHDAYGYLAKAYGMTVSGFVSTNPGVEPSVAQRRKLSTTLRQLRVPAVFIEPTQLQSNSVLAQVAKEARVAICPIYSESLDQRAPTYAAMMRFNADSLARCLR